MKRYSLFPIFCLLLCGAAWAAETTIPFTPSAWKTVTFAKIPPTDYKLNGTSLEAKVDRSSALLVTPWEKPRKVRAISFEWKTDGEIQSVNGATEKSKKGDDARIKVAILLSGPAPFIPFFAPGWIKAIAAIMRHPTDRALNLTATRHLPEGTKWESPYSSSIEHVAIAGTKTADGWQRVQYQLPAPQEAVGLWLMADGDDTASSFTTTVRELKVTFDE